MFRIPARLRFVDPPAPAGDAPPADPPPAGTGTPPAADPPPAGDADTGDTPPADLGAAGQQAIDRMKAERKAAKDEAAAEKTRADALQAKLDGKEAEHAAELEKTATQAAAIKTANERILKANLRTAAKGKVADDLLTDAVNMLDLTVFEVSEDGETDEAALAAAIDALVTKKPSLAAQGGQRFQGGADGGARNGQVTSIDKAIAEAEKARDFQTVIALKQQRSAQLAKKS